MTLRGERYANSPPPAWLPSCPTRQGVPAFRKGQERPAEHCLLGLSQNCRKQGNASSAGAGECSRRRAGPSAAPPESLAPAANPGIPCGREGDPPPTWRLPTLFSLSAFNPLKLIFIWGNFKQKACSVLQKLGRPEDQGSSEVCRKRATTQAPVCVAKLRNGERRVHLLEILEKLPHKLQWLKTINFTALPDLSL